MRIQRNPAKYANHCNALRIDAGSANQAKRAKRKKKRKEKDKANEKKMIFRTHKTVVKSNLISRNKSYRIKISQNISLMITGTE